MSLAFLKLFHLFPNLLSLIVTRLLLSEMKTKYFKPSITKDPPVLLAICLVI